MAGTYQSPYELATQVAKVFNFDQRLVNKGSLREYQQSQSGDDRPWHRYLALSNQKLTGQLGIKMRTLTEGLEEMKELYKKLPKKDTEGR